MTAPPRSPDFKTVIDELYQDAGIPLPSAHRCIVPLSDLVSTFNLTCTELQGLTGQIAINYLLQRGGLIEPPDDVPQGSLAGFIYANSHVGAIFVEQNDLLVRRRFSIAHELGHYMLHFRPLLTTQQANGEPALLEVMEAFPFVDAETEPGNLPIGYITLTRPETTTDQSLTLEQMEREANQFAGELLMPSGVVQELVAHYAPTFHDDDLVWRLSTDMLVSRSAMQWRLRNLELLPLQSSRWN